MEKDSLTQFNSQMTQAPKKSPNRISGSGRRGTFYSTLAKNPTLPAEKTNSETSKKGSRIFVALRN